MPRTAMAPKSQVQRDRSHPRHHHDDDDVESAEAERDTAVRQAQVAVQGPMNRTGASALQRTAGNQATIQRLRTGSQVPRTGGAARGPMAPVGGVAGVAGRPVPVQTEPPTTEQDKWHQAAAHYNLPMDSGHFVSWALHEKAILPMMVKEKSDREEILFRAKVIEHKMYGPGKWGDAMRNVDMASRISHLIGMLAGLVALVAGIVGIFNPAALPVASIAGIIALAAHGAMAILQGILIGYNVKRIQGMAPAEKAKVMPTIYRDILKLVFALVGVAAGGVGVGFSAAAGVMSNAALEGTEKALHIGHLVGESVLEGGAETGMFWGIAYNDKTEADIGMKGGYDEDLAKARNGGGHDGHGGGPQPDPDSGSHEDPGELVKKIEENSSESESGMQTARQSSVDAVSALQEQSGQVQGLDQITTTAPDLRRSVTDLGQEDGDKSKVPDEDESSIAQKEQQVTKAEQVIGEKSPDDGGAKDSGKDKAPEGEKVQVSTKPSIFSRMGAWIRRRFVSLKARVKKLTKKLQDKLGTLLLKILGLKKIQDQLTEGIGEKRVEATASTGALTDASELAGKYSEAAKTLSSAVTGPKTRARR